MSLPQRRLEREFIVQQVPNTQKPNTHKHERVLFLFNDLIVITKPRVPYQPGTAHEAPSANRFQFRYQFNFVTMQIVERKDNLHHANMLELNNVNGSLIIIAFATVEEKVLFAKMLSEFIEEVADQEEEKKTKLHQLVTERIAAAKEIIENAYSGVDPKAVAAPTENSSNRFSKYGSLRNARLALQAQSSAMFGKPKVKKANTDGEKLPNFRTAVRLATPSPSPAVLGSSTANEADAVAEPGLPQAYSHGDLPKVAEAIRTNSQSRLAEIQERDRDADNLIFAPIERSGTVRINANISDPPHSPDHLPNKLRKRRHTMAGIDKKKFA